MALELENYQKLEHEQCAMPRDRLFFDQVLWGNKFLW